MICCSRCNRVKKHNFVAILAHVHFVILDARQLAGEHNIVRAARKILSFGPRAVVVKRGEYGALFFSGEEVFASQIATLNTEQLMELSENLKKGIPIATPVFDGARMSDIEGMLVRAGLNTSGQVVLTDGRTGEWCIKLKCGRVRGC